MLGLGLGVFVWHLGRRDSWGDLGGELKCFVFRELTYGAQDSSSIPQEITLERLSEELRRARGIIDANPTLKLWDPYLI